MNLADVRELCDDTSWATGRVLDAAAGLSAAAFVDPTTVTARSLRGPLVHVHQLDVAWCWRLRWRGWGEAPEMTEAGFPTAAALVERGREDAGEMRPYLDGLDNAALARPVALGGGHPMPLWRYLVHVVNHGTRPRSDAAVRLTRYGRSPGDLDVADFAQERAAAANHEPS